MILNIVWICFHWSNLHLAFSELSILTIKHGLLGNYMKRNVCYLATNYAATTDLLSYKSENFFSDHRPEGRHDLLPSCKEEFFSYHNLLPFAVVELQIKKFFPDEPGFSYRFSKVSGKKYTQLYRNHTHFESIGEHVTTCMRPWCKKRVKIFFKVIFILNHPSLQKSYTLWILLWIRDAICLCCGESKYANKSVRKILKQTEFGNV